MATDGVKLTSAQTAAKLGTTEHTLRTWRWQGRGPKWHTLGRKRSKTGRGSRPRVYYFEHEVDAFLNGGSHEPSARQKRKR
jgi:hypothetical protein